VGVYICGFVMCGFRNVWVCLCVGFVMCRFRNVWVCIYVGFVMCGFCNVWVFRQLLGCFDNVCTCVYCLLYFCTVFLFFFFYIYSYLFGLYKYKDYCHRITTQLQY